ncbi:MAG: AAA family ATPase [Candidatus Latescibacter sp.]|nr:AAA family ATPase [Candidatus Latescibacter sp.]
MNEDYLTWWGMTKPPFSLTPDPEMLYLSGQHAECLMRLKYAIFSHKGGALLVSDTAGNGKTSILARLQNDLKEYYAGRVRVVYIDHPTLSPIEIIGEIARQLGGELHTEEKIRSLNYLRDRLFTHYNENIKVVVIVDEGQMLKERPDILGELRILLNFCVSDAFLLTFIFSGQKPLDSILRDMPEFWQRLPVRFFLKNLDFNDTRSLVQFRLRKVGAAADIFTDDAFEGIYNYSEGCPRIICAVADLCLLVGFSKGVKRIGFVEVSIACRDMETSGDSFHYFAYIKGRQPSARPKPEPAPSTSESRPALPQKAEKAPSPLAALLHSIPCPRCTEPNPQDRRYCLTCDTPLYRKCPACGNMADTVSNECPTCHADMNNEGVKAVEKLCEALLPYDVLERNYAVWLQASGVALEKGEKIIIIFTSGNLFNSGPTVSIPAKPGKSARKNCDLILTDRRLILEMPDDRMETELIRIETCMVAESGSLLGKRYELIIGLKKGIYTIQLPRNASKSKRILDRISSHIQAVMLK